MITRWIVATYKSLVEMALWVLVLGGALVGALMGAAAGSWMLGMVGGAVATFILAVVFFGAILLLGNIRDMVVAIERHVVEIASMLPRYGNGSGDVHEK